MGKKKNPLIIQIEGLKEYLESKKSRVKNQADVAFLENVLYVVEELAMRQLELEKFIGPGDAFITADAPDLPNKII